MSDLGLHATVRRIPASALPWAAGVAVGSVVLAMLLHPALGLYITEGVALVAALGTAGLVMFTAVAPGDVPVRRWLRRPVVVFAVTAYVAFLLTLPFDELAIADNGLRGLGDSLARSVVLHSGEWQTAVVRGAGLIVVFVGVASDWRSARWIALAGGLVVVGSFGLMGHARTYSPQAAVVAAVVAHVAAAAAWFGGLVGLGIALHHTRRDPRTSGRLLATFARVMEAGLGILLAAGVGLTILYLPGPGALIHTAYGQVLLIKLAILVGVLVLSTANHFRLVDAARSGNAAAVRVLRANIAAEQIGLLAILAITAVLMRQDPLG